MSLAPCPSCNTPVQVSPGIGPYCPNVNCWRVDDLRPESTVETMRARVRAMMAPPLPGMLMAQSTHRLGEIHKLQAKVEELRAAIRRVGTHNLMTCQKCRPMPYGQHPSMWFTSEDYAKWHESQPCTCGFSAALEL